MSTTAGHETLTRLLAGADLFKDLGGDDQAICAAKMQELRFEKGQTLFRQGDAGTRLYLMAKGQVRLAIASKSGRGLSFQIAVAGDPIGEIAILDGGPRSATATALTPVMAYALERSAFQELWSARPDIANAIIAFLCRRLRKASDRLEATTFYPLEVRVARFLLAELGDRQAPPGRRVPLELGFSQGELALLLGASRPKVNAALGVLENAGAIRRTSDRIFCEPAKLALAAQKDDD
jgi:CRP/FNR family transcriptional regulator, cyclic AMP receptor protein